MAYIRAHACGAVGPQVADPLVDDVAVGLVEALDALDVTLGGVGVAEAVEGVREAERAQALGEQLYRWLRAFLKSI